MYITRTNVINIDDILEFIELIHYPINEHYLPNNITDTVYKACDIKDDRLLGFMYVITESYGRVITILATLPTQTYGRSAQIAGLLIEAGEYNAPLVYRGNIDNKIHLMVDREVQKLKMLECIFYF